MADRKTTRKQRKRDLSRYRTLALIHAANTLLNKSVEQVEYPGGKNRESFRLILDDESTVIATRRDSVSKARREATILSCLSKHTTAVPELIATNHSQVLIQEEKLGDRFSQRIVNADAADYKTIMGAALSSLNEIHRAAEIESLGDVVKPLGYQREWLGGLFQRPHAIGQYLSVEAPDLDFDALAELLEPRDNAFIKWDTRPGNALVTDNNEVVWFDWEHAGRRNRLDDVAWIMADEYVPDMPGEETELLQHYLPLFAPKKSYSEALDYLMAYGTFHMLVRLGLILKFKEDEDWWDMDMCIRNDKIGITQECANWICLRGARWSAQSSLIAPLSDWFDQIRIRINEL